MHNLVITAMLLCEKFKCCVLSTLTTSAACLVEVERQVVTRCAEDGARAKRSAQTTGVLITISILPSTVGGNESLAAVTEALGRLNSSARAGVFTVHLGSLAYPLAVNSTYVDALVDCAPGFAFIPHYCVPCGPGTRGLENYCGLCDVGTYQPLPAQTSCRPCPKGWSTAGRGSSSSEECTVALPSSAAEVKNVVLIIAATVGSILGLALTVLIVVIIIKKVTALRAKVDPMIQMTYVTPWNCDVSNVKYKA